jgi:hypothetical protein
LEYRRQQEAFAKKVKKLEEEDAKLRLQEQLERKLRGEDYSTSKPDMSPLELLRQMEKQNSNPK